MMVWSSGASYCRCSVLWVLRVLCKPLNTYLPAHGKLSAAWRQPADNPPSYLQAVPGGHAPKVNTLDLPTDCQLSDPRDVLPTTPIHPSPPTPPIPTHPAPKPHPRHHPHHPRHSRHPRHQRYTHAMTPHLEAVGSPRASTLCERAPCVSVGEPFARLA